MIIITLQFTTLAPFSRVVRVYRPRRVTPLTPPLCLHFVFADSVQPYLSFTTISYFQLKFKRRVYKMLNLDEKQLKNINSRTNLKKFLDHVLANNVEKVGKMCNKGLDPNFHCPESGETPLSLISGIRNRPARMVMALVNGGAILDYRTKDGATAMHRAVATNNIEAVRTMLELGARYMYINPQNFFALYFHLSNPIPIHSCIFSPNYRDGKSLTPVYHSVINPTDPVVTETLLHDHGLIGSQDLQGWQEVHQVGGVSLSFVVVTTSVTLVSFLILSVLHSASIGGVPGHLNDRLMTD